MKKYKDWKVTTKITSLIGLAVFLNALITILGKDFLDRKELYTGHYGQNAKTFLIIVSVLFTVVLIGSGYYIRKSIKQPLDEILTAIKIIGDGGVEVKLEKINDDEFGIIIDALNATVDNIKEDAHIAREIAAGDLSMTVTPRTEIDELGQSFKSLLDDHNHVLGSIKEASMQVTTGSGQVASASHSLAAGSTEQASAIEQVTAAIDEIAQRTRNNAEEVNTANSLVIETKEGVVKGNSQMQEMMIAMDDINKSSEDISKIIKVIDDIAFQTNILALNAAVEAARAGDAGKGFAVVAEEVRNLAAKSASAATETAEMIEDSIQKVEIGSRIASETADSLEKINVVAQKSEKIITDIVKASNYQATAIAQIDQAIEQVSQVVQTNSATSEECAAASVELSNQASRVMDMVSVYRLGGHGVSSAGMKNGQSNKYENNADKNEQIISLRDGFGKY